MTSIFFKTYVLSVLTNTSVLHSQNKSFMRVKGSAQLSIYRMRSSQLRVADEFIEHVKMLPLEYEKGIYFAFLEDYGTHYTRNGKSGGEYELIYVLNQDTIREKSMFTTAGVSIQNNNFNSQKFSVMFFFFLFLNSEILSKLIYFTCRFDRENHSRVCQIRPHCKRGCLIFERRWKDWQ